MSRELRQRMADAREFGPMFRWRFWRGLGDLSDSFTMKRSRYVKGWARVMQPVFAYQIRSAHHVPESREGA